AVLGNPILEGSSYVLRLTDNFGQSGSAFLTDPISLAADASFSTMFSFQIDNNQNGGADGIAFVVQTVSNTAGGAGGGLGYQGLPNSIGIEFDTWNNGAGSGDFNASHIGVDINGNIASVASVPVNPVLDGNPNFGGGGGGPVWYAWVDYDGATDQLEVRLSTSNTRPVSADISYNVDLVSVLGQTSAFVGFTSGTGAASAHHDILSWEFNNSFKPIGADPCGNTSAETLVFTATDAAGNKTSCTSTFTIQDTTPPSIGVAASSSTVECDGSGNSAQLNAWLASRGGAQASDACGTVTWSHNFSGLSNLCGATGSATVTFTATDECGNASITTATFTIVDTTPPSLVAAAGNQVVECDGAGNPAQLGAWLASNGGAQANDACGSVTWSHNFSGLSNLCGATGSATVTFTATDECGNASSTTATFTIVDTTPPSLVAAAGNQVVECDGAGNPAQLGAWLASNGGAQANDACGSVTWSHNFSGLSNLCGATGSATVTFTATDECGNASSTTATFTIVDATAPSILVDAGNQVVECDGAGNQAQLGAWLASNGGAQASDTCGAVTWSNNFSSLSDLCGATGLATVTFTATDECGNASSTTATFTIVDTTPPSVTAAADQVVECDGSGNTAQLNAWLASNGGAQAGDVCGAVTWSNNFTSLSDLCGATGMATVTFTATDECGNVSSTTATFTIVDTTPPVLTSDVHDIFPKDAPITFTVSSQDVCGDVTISLSVRGYAINGAGKEIDKSGSYVIEINGSQLTIIDSGGVGTIFEITATGVDDCGNQTVTTFVVNVLRPDNEGVGNGVDGNTPGHDNNGGNDDPPFTPGNPGAKNKPKP
ncbi:MAG: hypothetical protein AB1813_15230, partial [Verrucomicrobiota bacterium]